MTAWWPPRAAAQPLANLSGYDVSCRPTDRRRSRELESIAPRHISATAVSPAPRRAMLFRGLLMIFFYYVEVAGGGASFPAPIPFPGGGRAAPPGAPPAPGPPGCPPTPP